VFPLQEHEPERRAHLMLDQAAKIGCRKFVRPKDVVKGNARLNMAFVANLFNTHPALKADEGLPDFDLGDYGETREEKSMLFLYFEFITITTLNNKLNPIT